MGLHLHFFGSFGAIFWALWGRGHVQKQFWNLLMHTIKFCFGSAALSFSFEFGQVWGLFAHFGSFGTIRFGPLGAIFGVRVRFKNIFGTHLCRQSILVLEVQPYLLFLIRRNLWPSLIFLGLSGLFLLLGSGFKTFWRPTYID